MEIVIDVSSLLAVILDCALRQALPLLTLDRTLKRAAREIAVRIMEV